MNSQNHDVDEQTQFIESVQEPIPEESEEEDSSKKNEEAQDET